MRGRPWERHARLGSWRWPSCGLCRGRGLQALLGNRFGDSPVVGGPSCVSVMWWVTAQGIPVLSVTLGPHTAPPSRPHPGGSLCPPLHLGPAPGTLPAMLPLSPASARCHSCPVSLPRGSPTLQGAWRASFNVPLAGAGGRLSPHRAHSGVHTCSSGPERAGLEDSAQTTAGQREGLVSDILVH